MLNYIYTFIKSVSSGNRYVEIDLYEWDKSDVQCKRLPNNTQWSDVAKNKGVLKFTLLELAHAVAKTDFLIRKNLAFNSLAFLISGNEILRFSSSGNLRLIDDLDSILNDVTLTSFIGRLGQGVTLLLGTNLGYTYVGHLASDDLVKAHIDAHNISVDKKERFKIADFLFEDANKNRAIIESKCSYSIQDFDASDIKGILKPALENQVIPWAGKKVANISKGYAAHSALREIGQMNNSAITYVDPPGNAEVPLVDLPNNWAKTRNYASWFSLFNLKKCSSLLIQYQTTELELVYFDVIDIGCESFVVMQTFSCNGQLVVSGLELQVMIAISAYFEGNDSALRSNNGLISEFDYNRENYSIFPDGSFIGLIDNSDFSPRVAGFLMPREP